MIDQPATPWLNAVEKWRPFAPNYDSPLDYRDLNPADWQHVCSARFGEARPCSWSATTKWSGDSYRYDIYQREAGRATLYALRWTNGSGCGWLTCENRAGRGEWSLLDTIAAVPDEARRWDACHFLWECAHKTALAAQVTGMRLMANAYVQKRLRKVGGHVKVIEPEAENLGWQTVTASNQLELS